MNTPSFPSPASAPSSSGSPAAPAQGPALSTHLLRAAEAVQMVREGGSLTAALARCPSALRPAAQALSFTVLRRLGSAEAARAHLVPKAPAPAVDALLLTALALLWPAEGDAPPYEDHTLVNQAVAAAKRLQASSASFVNAVLRRFLRERATLVPLLLRQPVAQSNHPVWWVQQLQRDWPAHWKAILQANNQHAPMSLRVQARRGSAADYLQRLLAAGLGGRTHNDHPLLPQAVQLERPAPVHQLPGFADGDVSVQDLAAQLAAPLLLQNRPGLPVLPAKARVLDACAAPGGKTAHLLELADMDLWALDSDAQRLVKVSETVERLKLPTPHILAADAAHTARWWDGQAFDAILLDAPCSASGIVRRHPDIRWLRRPEDLPALARTQDRLLRSLWPLVKPGGRLLYATCSVFLAEGPQVVQGFLRDHPDAQHFAEVGGSLLPGLSDPSDPLSSPGDGFFYALLVKASLA
ncbi:MAG: 16S rRNA (cytosine(967)-C(5))-methyltransferase RsmB, partial [Pseudomonadota bacterium]